MKKVLTVVLCLLVFSGVAIAKSIKGQLKQGVYKYKNGNYIGCMQTMVNIIKQDPANTLAHYYLAISYVQIGQKEKAIDEYNKVITINPSSQLATYALAGIKYLQSLPTNTSSIENEKTEFIANSTAEETNFDAYQNNQAVVNNVVQEEPTYTNEYKQNKKNENYYSANTSKIEEQQDNKDETKVSDKELADALRVIIKASRGSNANSNINPEMLQMNMMMSALGGSNGSMGSYNSMMGMTGNNNAFNMIPMLMMQQKAGKKMDPEMMKSIITTSLMPDMYSMFGNNNKNY